MARTYLYLGLLLGIILLSGCAQEETAETVENISGEEPEKETNLIPIGEISQHNSSEDCWLAINGKVYDVTDYIPSHPAGNTILEGCGTDATELYETRPMGSGTPHSEDARELLNDYYIGDLG